MAHLHPEDDESLWMLAAPPLAWALHLLASYATAAVWCAKFAGPLASLAPVRAGIGVYTAAALLVIAIVGLRGLSRHRRTRGGHSTVSDQDRDTSGARHGFMGLATALLAGLSAVAVVFQALSAVFIGSCR